MGADIPKLRGLEATCDAGTLSVSVWLGGNGHKSLMRRGESARLTTLRFYLEVPPTPTRQEDGETRRRAAKCSPGALPSDNTSDARAA